MDAKNSWASHRLALHRAQDPRRYRPLCALVSVLFSVVLFFATTIAFVWFDLSRALNKNSLDTAEIRQSISGQSDDEKKVDPLLPGEPLNILVLGIDSRKDQSPNFGSIEDAEGVRGDTTILVHISRDRSSMTLVSIPRDLMVRIPNCRLPNGEESMETFGQINSAMMIGSGADYDIAHGVACAQSTVENLTGLQIDNFAVVDFRGFESAVDALGGVWFDVPQDVEDPEANAHLSKGCQLLNGEQALGYVRARKSLGDGSDTLRIGRQQEFVAALVREVSRKVSNGDLPTFITFLRSVLSVLQVSPQLASLETDLSLLVTVANLPQENTRIITMPREPWVEDPNRDQPQEPYASQLWQSLREDTPLPSEIGYLSGDGQSSVAPEATDLEQAESLEEEEEMESTIAQSSVAPETHPQVTCPPNSR